ncbi:hypothetical protein [Streptomyces sp. Inha503]|uniref:hypothetical protein n=1 Tax=Streptomyces sp. Inha503 TaxID=3383314 RepID=UPI00399F77B6
MSTLSVPRLYFKGAATWNPGTANNNDYWPIYDFSQTDLNWTHLQNYKIDKANAKSKFPEYARSLHLVPPDPDVGGERELRVCPAEWNYYGGMEWWLHSTDQQTVITGGQTSLGGEVVTDDPVVGAVLDVVGDPFPGSTFNTPPRMVDNDPASYWCTNFLLRRFNLGTRAAPERFLTGTLEEDAPCMTSRWLTMNRNLDLDKEKPVVGDGVGGVVLQTCLPTENLEWDPDTPSALLRALQDGLKQPHVRGLMVRLSAYLSGAFTADVFKDIPITDTNKRYAALAALWEKELAENRVPSANPSVATVVGTLGLWYEDELRSSPGGRVLFCSKPCPTRKDPEKKAWLGPIFAELQPSGSSKPTHLSLDLGNAIPEVSSTREKYNAGRLEVRALTRFGLGWFANTVGSISTSDYDKAAYESRAGIVDLPLPDVPNLLDSIRSGLLDVVANPSTPVRSALAERPVIAETDDRSVYLDRGDTGRMSLQVREHGLAPTRDITVQVRQYLASPAPPLGGQQWQLADEDDGIVQLKEQAVTVKAGVGKVDITFTANLPGNAVLAFFIESEDIPPFVYPVPDLAPLVPPPPEPGIRLTTASASFGCVRVLPFDDDLPQQFGAAYADSNFSKDAAWEWLYENVLRVYDLLYPAMKYYAQLDLGDSTAVEKNIDQIVQLCNPKLRSSTVYMPVTRELSRGKRNVLKAYQWLVNNNWPKTQPPETCS